MLRYIQSRLSLVMAKAWIFPVQSDNPGIQSGFHLTGIRNTQFTLGPVTDPVFPAFKVLKQSGD